MIVAFSWVLALTSIWCTFLQGNRGGLGWALGFGNTILWILYSVLTKQWAFIPLNIVLAAVQIRNFVKNNEV